MDSLRTDVIDLNTEDAGILRTSTPRQQVDGDSPDIQKEKINFAVSKQCKTIGIWIKTAMPASGKFETQPLLKALEYFETIPAIKRVWFSIVNRGTRGELLDFLLVQQAYSKKGIELCDAEGELKRELKDTLEVYGVEYKFNRYNANEQKIIDAILGARRNWRENLSQLHAAEIKAARMGYWVTTPVPNGYKAVRKQTEHGKRLLLEHDEREEIWFKKMFELALKKVPRDIIVEEVNKLGYISHSKTKNGKEVGRKKLTIKQLDVYLSNPIYALIRNSKCQQTQGKPVRIHGTPYLNYGQFNEINRGKINILEINGEIKIVKGKLSARSVKTKGDNYPYKRFVLCPVCHYRLYAGATRSRSGKHIPRYHCQHSHKYWSINKGKFDQTIKEFTEDLRLTDEKLRQYKEQLLGKVQDKLITLQGVSVNYQLRVAELESLSQELRKRLRKPDLLDVVFEDLHKELEKVENEKLIAMAERDKVEAEQIDINLVINRVTYFLEHLGKGLLGIPNLTKRAAAWSTVFAEPPTYEELVSRTARLRSHIKLISQAKTAESLTVGDTGFEPVTFSTSKRRSTN